MKTVKCRLINVVLKIKTKLSIILVVTGSTDGIGKSIAFQVRPAIFFFLLLVFATTLWDCFFFNRDGCATLPHNPLGPNGPNGPNNPLDPND